MPEKRKSLKAKKAAAAAPGGGNPAPFAHDNDDNATVLGISREESATVDAFTAALTGARLLGKDVSEVAKLYEETDTEAVCSMSVPTINGRQVSFIMTGIRGYLGIDWGDGSKVEMHDTTNSKSHTYAVAGTYTVAAWTMGSSDSFSATVT